VTTTWNDLPEEVKWAESLTTFRRLLNKHLFRKSFPDYLLDINWLSPVDLAVLVPLLRPAKSFEWMMEHNVTYGQTDGRTNCRGNTAFCVAWRGNGTKFCPSEPRYSNSSRFAMCSPKANPRPCSQLMECAAILYTKLYSIYRTSRRYQKLPDIISLLFHTICYK